MIMLQKYLCMSDTFSIFVIGNQANPNGSVATYHQSKT